MVKQSSIGELFTPVAKHLAKNPNLAGGAIGALTGGILGANTFNDTPIAGVLGGAIMGGATGAFIATTKRGKQTMKVLFGKGK